VRPVNATESVNPVGTVPPRALSVSAEKVRTQAASKVPNSAAALQPRFRSPQ
jgi:hypothetical protein